MLSWSATGMWHKAAMHGTIPQTDRNGMGRNSLRPKRDPWEQTLRGNLATNEAAIILHRANDLDFGRMRSKPR